MSKWSYGHLNRREKIAYWERKIKNAQRELDGKRGAVAPEVLSQLQSAVDKDIALWQKKIDELNVDL